MLRVVDRTDEFISMMNSNNQNTLEAIGEFCKDKMDKLVAVDTGLLQSNNDYKVGKNEVVLSNSTDYAIHQEFGTRKMKAHPFMRPSALNYSGDIARISAEGLGEGM